MTDILLLIAAPIIQIILSVFRIFRRITAPLVAIAVLCIAIGITMSYIAGDIAQEHINYTPGRARCNMIGFAFFIGGSFINMIAISVIGLVNAGIYYYRHKSNQQPTDPNISIDI